MRIEPIYYAVFYDLEKPKQIQYAMNKRIDRSQYKNLIDDMEGKTVELRTNGGVPANYKIISVATFIITNTVDNHLFVVCDCEKINDDENIKV